MDLKLKRINIGHFKGISSFGMTLKGDSAVITAANGVGKTTVYDAFLWLLFGKDSTGRKEFELRTLDRHNQPIKGLVLAVEADIYKKVLKGQKDGYVKERDEINPRLDEILRGLEHPEDIDVENLQKERTSLQKQIQSLAEHRQELFGKETQRQAKIEAINNLKTQRIEREAELKSDTSGIQALLDEKQEIVKNCGELDAAVGSAKVKVSRKKSEIESSRHNLQKRQDSLDETRKELKKAEDAKITTVCYACGQKLPKEKLSENESGKTTKVGELAANCNELMKIVDGCRKEVEINEAKLNELVTAQKQAEQALLEAQEYKTQRFEKIDEAIETNVTTPPEQDETWQKITAEIARAEVELGASVSEQLEAIESQRVSVQAEIDKLNEKLAQADRLEKDRIRVKELERDEKVLAQKIADIEKQLSEIDNYNRAESELIEAEVNDRFEHVNFKLFKENLNKTLEPCCEALFKTNGVPYKDMSAGQQILCGIDIINVLSEHYSLSVTLFIDHAESLTYPIEATGQTIELYAKVGVSQLQVTTKAKTAKAVA